MKEQKARRENQVTMYRKYRTGDLPDIQIKYFYIIAPLQALAHVSYIPLVSPSPLLEMRGVYCFAYVSFFVGKSVNSIAEQTCPGVN